MPVTEQCRLAYPAETERNWYAEYESFMAELDAALFASREDRNLTLSAGEFALTDLGAGLYRLSWAAGIGIVAPTTGYYWTLAAGSVDLAAATPFAVVELSARGIQAAGTATISAEVTVPNTDTAFLLAFKVPVGGTVIFRNGVWMAANTQREVFQQDPPIRSQANDTAFSTPDIWYNTATGLWMMSTGAGGVSPLSASHIQAPVADGYAGITTDGLLKENASFGDVVYRDAATGGWRLAQGNAVGATPARGVVVTAGGGLVDDTVVILRTGYVRNSGWAWTDGDNLWVATAVAGGLQNTAPAVVGQVAQVVAGAESATLVWFNLDTPWAVV
jgi:hypothetical protein